MKLERYAKVYTRMRTKEILRYLLFDTVQVLSEFSFIQNFVYQHLLRHCVPMFFLIGFVLLILLIDITKLALDLSNLKDCLFLQQGLLFLSQCYNLLHVFLNLYLEVFDLFSVFANCMLNLRKCVFGLRELLGSGFEDFGVKLQSGMLVKIWAFVASDRE